MSYKMIATLVFTCLPIFQLQQKPKWCKNCDLLKIIKDALMMKLDTFIKSSSSSSAAAVSSSSSASSPKYSFPNQMISNHMASKMSQEPLSMTVSSWMDPVMQLPMPSTSMSSSSSSSLWAPWWLKPTSSWWLPSESSVSWWSPHESSFWW